MSLAGRCAIVTGGARGIGLTLSRVLCEAGLAVAVNDVNADGAAKAAAELSAKGHRAIGVPGDVTQAADAAAMVARAEKELGPLWLLVNNAGTFHSAPTEEFPEEMWDREFDVDVKGAFLCSQAALRVMIPRKAGRIVVVSSIAGWIVRTRQIAYCAAKAAAIHFARCLAVEMAPHGITVNCLCPGWTNTSLLDFDAIARRTGTTAEAAREKAYGESFQHRVLEPEELAGMAVLLASEDGRGMTGQVVSVDGGYKV